MTSLPEPGSAQEGAEKRAQVPDATARVFSGHVFIEQRPTCILCGFRWEAPKVEIA